MLMKRVLLIRLFNFYSFRFHSKYGEISLVNFTKNVKNMMEMIQNIFRHLTGKIIYRMYN